MRRLLGGLLVVVDRARRGAPAAVLLLQSRDDARASDGGRPGRRERRRRPAARTQAAAIARDARPGSPSDQLRHALELGDVVLLYGGTRPPGALRALQDELTRPVRRRRSPPPAQAVILARRRDHGRRGARLAAGGCARARADDPQLREFADYWLGEARRALPP